MLDAPSCHKFTAPTLYPLLLLRLWLGSLAPPTPLLAPHISSSPFLRIQPCNTPSTSVKGHHDGGCFDGPWIFERPSSRLRRPIATDLDVWRTLTQVERCSPPPVLVRIFFDRPNSKPELMICLRPSRLDAFRLLTSTQRPHSHMMSESLPTHLCSALHPLAQPLLSSRHTTQDSHKNSILGA